MLKDPMQKWNNAAYRIRGDRHKNKNDADKVGYCWTHWVHWAARTVCPEDDGSREENSFNDINDAFSDDAFMYHLLQEFNQKLNILVEYGQLKEEDYRSYMKNIFCDLNLYKHHYVMASYLELEDLLKDFEDSLDQYQ